MALLEVILWLSMVPITIITVFAIHELTTYLDPATRALIEPTLFFTGMATVYITSWVYLGKRITKKQVNSAFYFVKTTLKMSIIPILITTCAATYVLFPLKNKQSYMKLAGVAFITFVVVAYIVAWIHTSPKKRRSRKIE